jgi:hypothetical protein
MKVASRPSVSRSRPTQTSRAQAPSAKPSAPKTSSAATNKPAAATERQAATKTQQTESRRQAQAADQMAQQRVMTQQQNNVSQANTQKVQEQQSVDAANTNQAPKRSHGPGMDGQLNGQFKSNVAGTQIEVSKSRNIQNGRTVDASQQTKTQNSLNERTVSTERQATAQNSHGQNVQSLQSDVSITDKKNGQQLAEKQRISESSAGRSTAQVNQTETNQSNADRIKKGIQDNTNIGVDIAGAQIGDIGKFHGAFVMDHRMTEDRTGAGGEVHALAGSAQAGGGGTFDPKSGEVHMGGNAGVRADLVGANGRIQLGSTNSAAGAGFLEGEGHVGARAEVAGGIGIKSGVAEARAEASAFVGAEARVTGGYENSYLGASVTGRIQAGAGVSGEVGVSYNRGKINLDAGLSAALGLGAGANADITIDAGQIATDGAAVSEEAIRANVNNALDMAGYSDFTPSQKKEIGDVFMDSLAANPITQGIAHFSLWLGL